MATLDITISKARVIDEVQKATEYIGKKSMNADDTGVYERVSAVDADRELLERYWMEACAGATTALAEWLNAADDQMLGHHYDPSRDYHVELSLPSNRQENLDGAIQEALTGYFVNLIASKWLMIALPSLAEAHAVNAAGCMALVKSHLLSRKRVSSRLQGWNGSGGSGSGGVLPDDVVRDAEYTHTDNNYTDADKAAVGMVAGLAEAAANKADKTDVDNLAATVANKADKSTVTELTATVRAVADELAGKADKTAVESLAGAVADKADKTTVAKLAVTVGEKADKTEVNSLAATVAGKADARSVTELAATVDGKAAFVKYATEPEMNSLDPQPEDGTIGLTEDTRRFHLFDEGMDTWHEVVDGETLAEAMAGKVDFMSFPDWDDADSALSGGKVRTGTIGFIEDEEVFAMYDTPNDDWREIVDYNTLQASLNQKADKTGVTTVGGSAKTSQSSKAPLNWGRFYDFLGTWSSLTLTLNKPSNSLLGVWAGRFTAAGDDTSFAVEGDVAVAEGSVTELREGHTYEFNIAHGVLILVDLGEL